MRKRHAPELADIARELENRQDELLVLEKQYRELASTHYVVVAITASGVVENNTPLLKADALRALAQCRARGAHDVYMRPATVDEVVAAMNNPYL